MFSYFQGLNVKWSSLRGPFTNHFDWTLSNRQRQKLHVNIYKKKRGICLSKKLAFKDKPYISKSFYGCCQCYSNNRKTVSHKNYFKTYPLKISSKLWKYVPMIPKIWVENFCSTTWHFTVTLILAVWGKHSIFIIQYFSEEAVNFWRF